MTIATRLLAAIAHLPAPRVSGTAVDRDVCVPMRDGVVLLADRTAPKDAGPLPTVLVRLPYGRRGGLGTALGRLLAEQGFNVVVQSVRGTFGSGGTFSPFLERDDGLDTIAWIRRQPWFGGGLATVGPSYLGLTQWALAAAAGDALKAVSIQVSASQFHGSTYPGGSFALANSLSWTHLISRQERRDGPLAAAAARRRLRRVLERLPLGRLDQLATGATVEFWQEWLARPEPDDPYWTRRSYDRSVPDVTAPVCMTTGWYDIFLPWQLADFAALRDAGRRPTLTIGPWAHTSLPLFAQALRETVAHLRAHLLDDSSAQRTLAVRVYVTGAGQWREYPDWPPPGARSVSWYLHGASSGAVGAARLAATAPEPSPPDRYRYDPARPTPSVAGPVLSWGSAKPTDNRAVERRPDVLTFTSGPLPVAVEVLGPVSAELYVRSSLEHTDFFVRLCDVHRGGKSVNVCDGLLRLRPGVGEPQPDGSRRIVVELWPAAHRFAAGHRLRVQVSSGAHPRYARNPGTGAPLADVSDLLPADQAVYHDPEHPSAIRLTVLPH